MRTLPALALAALPLSGLVVPDAAAQRRADAPSRFDSAPAATGLRQYVGRETFRTAQTLEMSAGTVGGMGYGVGAYTQSLFWQPTGRLAARVDVTAAVPFGGALGLSATPLGAGAGRLGQGLSPTVYVRNAELAYRPSASTELRLQFSQVPGGVAGMSAYGPGAYGHPYGSGLGVASPGGDLFWRSR